MGNVTKISLEHISKRKTTNQNTTTRDELGQIEDEEMEFGQEIVTKKTTGKEDDGGEPTSDVALDTYISYKAKQRIQCVESQGSTQGTNDNKDNDYTSMDSASTYTNKQRSSEDSELKMPIGKGTTNQEIDCNDISKITDTQTMDKDKTSNKAVNKDNLSPNIKQNKLQVQIKQEGITEAVNNLYKLPPKTRQNDSKNLSIIDDPQANKGRRKGPITRADPRKKMCSTPRGAVDEWLRQRPNDNIQERQIHSWGEELQEVKDKDSIRIAFLNVNGIGEDKLSQKSEDIKEFMLTYDADVFGMTETGINWRNSWKPNTLWERTRGWFENIRLSVTHNTKGKHKSKTQPGGTAMISANNMALHARDT